MRRILIAGLLFVPSVFPAAASASQSAIDPSTLTQTRPVSTGVKFPQLLESADVNVPSDSYDRIVPNNAEVVLSLNVDEQGKPQDIHIVKSVNKKLDERVVAAVRQFKWQPASLNKQTIPFEMTLKVDVKR